MSVKVVSLDALRAERRNLTMEQAVEYVLDGKVHTVTKRIVNGEMELLDLSRPIGEMITTGAGRKELLEKVVLDVEMGREQVPTLYGPIYERIQDRNFPELFDAKWANHGIVVFLEHIEGEEVKFGHLQAEEGPIARIKTYAAGFEYTEDMVEYNKTFEMEMLDRAFGEAYNALLNHLHFGPILSYSYKSANKTAAKYVDPEGKPLANSTGAHPLLSLRETLKQAIADAKAAKRPGNVLLVSGARADQVREALQAVHVRGTDYASLMGIDTIIEYDGWETKVGRRTYVYPGVDANKAYLIRPKRGFKELVKHDLLIDANDGDLSRLVEAQIVGRARRGVFAALDENVQEISLPQFS